MGLVGSVARTQNGAWVGGGVGRLGGTLMGMAGARCRCGGMGISQGWERVSGVGRKETGPPRALPRICVRRPWPWAGVAVPRGLWACAGQASTCRAAPRT
jgi:hypothetical protein